MPIWIREGGKVKKVPVRVLLSDGTWKLLSGAGFQPYKGLAASPVTDPTEVDSNGNAKGIHESIIIEAKPRLVAQYALTDDNAPADFNLDNRAATKTDSSPADMTVYKKAFTDDNDFSVACWDATKLKKAIGDYTIDRAELVFMKLRATQSPDFGLTHFNVRPYAFPASIGSSFPSSIGSSGLGLISGSGGKKFDTNTPVLDIPSAQIASTIGALLTPSGAIAFTISKTTTLWARYGGNDTSSTVGVMILRLFCTVS